MFMYNFACKGHPRNDLHCVRWDVEPYSLTQLTLSLLNLLMLAWPEHCDLWSTWCPKISDSSSFNHINSVCRRWILTKHCTLHYRSITYRRTYCDVRTLPYVFIVTLLRRQNLFTLVSRSICYWQDDQAVVYPLRTKSLHRGQSWPLL